MKNAGLCQSVSSNSAMASAPNTMPLSENNPISVPTPFSHLPATPRKFVSSSVSGSDGGAELA